MTCHVKNMIKYPKNNDFGAVDLFEISDAENHSDFGVLPENFLKKQPNYGIEVVKNIVFPPIFIQSKIGVLLWKDRQNTKNYGLEHPPDRGINMN